MDLSLDDFIKKNKIKAIPSNQRNRAQNAPGARRNSLGRNNTSAQSNNGRISKPRQPLQSAGKPRGSFSSQRPSVTDARLKIIQKNRRRLTDARDKLSELAKQTDARTRIKGRNLKSEVDRRRDRGPPRRDSFDREREKPAAPVRLQRSIRNNVSDMREPGLIRCTINRDMEDFSVRPNSMYTEDEEMPLVMRPRNDFSNIKVVAQNDYSHFGQEYISNVSEPIYVDHYDQPEFTREHDYNRNVPSKVSGARMSQEMRNRLDTPTKLSMMYNYPPPSHSPPPSQGHRIVVSNLHSSVTHEDIKELFEDIGPLVTSRLVRAGTAEVIYKQQKDAKKAVEAYHNRQLDGQPMKCLLVNPRSPTGSSGVLRSNNIPVPPKFPSSSKSMVVPDISAIHKALFTNK